MALNPEQVAALRDACGQIADPITAWLLRDAAQRIAGAGKMTSTAAYELYRANALGQSKRELKKFLKSSWGYQKDRSGGCSGRQRCGRFGTTWNG